MLVILVAIYNSGQCLWVLLVQNVTPKKFMGLKDFLALFSSDEGKTGPLDTLMFLLTMYMLIFIRWH